ncbi:FMN-binding protein [Clostridium vincentii]|uniref:Putative electron transport protein YccM n=1 Tax=Clostridium vincentii TaxID=52704 RepID=A0A2T0BFX4_9CLOT|nr:FMN-binding protein [Clostridium vincentii]PRR82806.1 putative electron transport protein YccM [Clostridium vincentii]
MGKIKKIQILRHIIQIILFLLLPGLYVLTFSELKTVYEMIINGNFSFIQAFPSLMEFAAVMFFTILMGRFFCGWLCAFGAYNDWIYLMSSKIFKMKFKVNEKVDALLKYVKYIVLLVLLIVTVNMGSLVLEGTSPWDVFGQITDLSNILSSLLIGFILFILITIGAFFIERFFCRYLCPLGAVFAIISKIGIVKINKPSDKCGECRICTNNCSMGLNLYKKEKIKGGDCINCLKCIEVCPIKNTNVNVLGEDVNATLASTVALATFVGVYGLTNLGGKILTDTGIATSAAVTSSVEDSTSTSQTYKDGTYTGSASGFKGTTKISVTIANGKISSIDTVSKQDDSSYYNKAESKISNSIISEQSTSVDTVSGATYSSKGIINAVENALSKAKNSTSEVASSSTTDSSEATSSTENSGSTTSNSTSAESTTTDNTTTGTYTDGTYTGSGTGFKGGTTKISVTVAGGKISSITTVSNEDTPKYYSRVESTITNSIISEQSTSVDTVSGATYSCKGIISAVENALSKA